MLCEELKLIPLTGEPEKEIRAALDDMVPADSQEPDARWRYAMAFAMKRCRGRVRGAQVHEIVTQLLKGGAHVG